MKNKWLVWIALLLIVVIIAVLIFDLFFEKKVMQPNIYEYQLDKFKKIDSSAYCYQELQKIKPSSAKIHSITVDAGDNIYITAGTKVLKFNPAGDSIFSFNISDSALCISIMKSGNILLGMKNHLEQYDKKGKLVKSWDMLGKTAWFTSIACDDSSVYVADAGNKIVHRYDLNGKLIGQIGKKDKAKGIPGFFIPSPYFDILIDKQGQLWAINTGRHAFEAYTKTGELITSWERTSMGLEGFCGCCNPCNVALLANGDFVTTEKGIARIKIHQGSGDFKCVLAGPDQFNEGTTGLDVAVDSKDRVIVLDPVKVELRIFVKKGR